ncbi:MAG: mechanosensitive ion channel family protein [Terriglobia bacterium]
MKITLQNLTHMIAGFLPHLIAMAIIVIVGWFIAWIVKLILRWILKVVQFNRLCETPGFTQMLAKAALPSPSELLSRLVFWVIWVTFILFGLNALNVTPLQDEISRFFLFLPQIFVAIVILFVGVLIANFFSRATLLAAVNSDSPSPRLLSSLVRFLIIILAVTMALERIGLGHGVVLMAFSIGFGAVMLALALAFGLGGRDAARRLLERRFPRERERDRRSGDDEEDDEGISHL